MRKFQQFTVAVIMFMAAVTGLKAQTNWVTNGSFTNVTDGVPDGWTINSVNGTTIVTDGDYSLDGASLYTYIGSDSKAYSVSEQSVSIAEGASYRFSFYYNYLSNTSTSGIKYYIVWQDDSENVISWAEDDASLMKPSYFTYNEALSNMWIPYEWDEGESITAPEGATKLNVKFYIKYCEGLLDSVKLVKVSGGYLSADTITMADVSVTYGNTATLSATSLSGEAITYTSNNTSIATISGNTLTAIGAGTATLTATTAGNDMYESYSKTINLTVNKAGQTVTLGDITKTYITDGDFDLSATATSGLSEFTYTIDNSSVATVNGSTVTLTGAGTATITATQAGNSNYNAASGTAVLTVNSPDKKNQTISNFSAISKTYGDAAFDLTATLSSGLDLTYTIADASVATLSGSTVTIVGVGSTKITAIHSGNDTLNAVSASATLTVSKAEQSISGLSNITLTYEDVDTVFTLPATTSAGLIISYDNSNSAVATLAENVLTCIKPGSATITATQAGNDNYNSVNASITVKYSKADQVLTGFEDKTLTEDSWPMSGYPIFYDVTISSGQVITYTSSDESIINDWDHQGRAVVNGVGTTNVTATASSTDYYNALSETAKVTVTTTSTSDISETSNSEGISIYPNPVGNSNTVTFLTDNIEGGMVSIYNVAGKKAIQQNIASGQTSIELNVDELNCGVYFLKYQAGNGEYSVIKFVK